MPSLVLDFSGQGEVWAGEALALRDAGESLLLCCRMPLAPPWVSATDSSAIDTAWENEQIPVLDAASAPPDWLALQDFSRVLLLTPAARAQEGAQNWRAWTKSHSLNPNEDAWLRALFACGCEAVDLLPVEDAVDLSQSWQSGRRAGLRLLAV